MSVSSLNWVLAFTSVLASSPAMFDWNDEELSNIIWDGAGESDDHIVPYREANKDYCKKKEWGQETVNTKCIEQKAPGTKVDIHGEKLESSSNFNLSEGTSASGFDLDSWPNLSLSNAVRTDQDSLDTSVSNNLTEITKLDSSGADTAQLDKSEIFQNPHDVKEQGDFVDYGWANIGSFDDLDRMFSNEDPIFGNVSLGNADELWSSSKDVANCISPLKSFPTSADSTSLGLGISRNVSEHYAIKTEYVQEADRPFHLGYGKMVGHGSQGLQNTPASLNHAEIAGRKSKPVAKGQTDLTTMGKSIPANSQLTKGHVAVSNQLAERVYRQKKPLKSTKKLEENNGLAGYQDFHGNWSSSGNPNGQFKNQFTSPIVHPSPASVLGQHSHLQGPESLQYPQISHPFMPSSSYGSIANPYSSMPVLSHIPSVEFKHQPLVSGYEASSVNAKLVRKLTDSPAKPQTMTPQEKIEKLRRRQQMQAMLAIQRQQQQLGQVSTSDQSMTQTFTQENQIQHVDGANIEDLSALASFDPNSPTEQDDSSAIPVGVNDYSVEDTILYRLQDIISKLDVSIRVCIRDSLFRLAQSAMQRNYACDTSSTNDSGRDEQVVTREEIVGPNRNSKMPDVETETNPIDRTVAHLLFHRPLELLGKIPDTPESPVSTKLASEHKAVDIAKMSMGCSPGMHKSKQNFSHQGSSNSCLVSDHQPVSQFKNNLCLDTSENASSIGLADEGAREVEASQ